jgi:hypothetical protein
MKRFVSLALCTYFSFSWADEFKLEFSRDIIDATQNQRDAFETPASSIAFKSNNPRPTASLPPIESESSSVDLELPEKTQMGSAGYKPALRSSRADSSRSTNQFTPLPVSSGNVFASFTKQSLQNPERTQNNLGVYDELHDEFKLMVGDEMYNRMAWSYEGVKQLDSWVSATLTQLSQGGSVHVGLNDQVIANFTAARQAFIPGQNVKSLEDSHADALKMPEYAARYGIDQATITANFENQSKFLVVLKYLSLSNLGYAILMIVTLVYGGKFFKFLIKQR